MEKKLRKNIKTIRNQVVFVASLLLLKASACQAGIMDSPSLAACRANGDCKLNDFMQVAVEFSKIILGISGSITLLFFVYGGVTFLTSSGSSERVTKGKQILINSVIGLVIILASYTIIGFILETLGVPGKENWFTTQTPWS